MSEPEKKPKVIEVYDERSKSIKTFPEKPGFLDYVKEGFQPTDTRADIDAMRRRRAKLGQP